jgi:hypothetical protein
MVMNETDLIGLCPCPENGFPGARLFMNKTMIWYRHVS